MQEQVWCAEFENVMKSATKKKKRGKKKLVSISILVVQTPNSGQNRQTILLRTGLVNVFFYLSSSGIASCDGNAGTGL